MTTEHPAAPILERFLDWATDPNVLILDTETTGLHGQVIELGIIDHDGRVLIDERFNPPARLNPAPRRSTASA